jgi:peptidoglycan/LPS O-acetylase OafA/YrhL
MSMEQDRALQKEARKRRETIYWAVVLIWAGLVFGAERLGVLPQIGAADAWNWTFFGAGLLALVWNMLRINAPDRSNPVTFMWNLVWAGVMLILGISPLSPVKIGLPLILLLLGAALLVTALSHADRSLA